MFTGIIEAKAGAISITAYRGGKRVRIKKPKGWKLGDGQSVNIDGVCSTVVAKDAKSFSVEYMPETLSKTAAGNITKGSELNLERSLMLHTRIDGHLVQGHVDTKGVVTEIKKIGMNHLVTVRIPKSLIKFVALHGSITVNGVSLTVARRAKDSATIALIPHTLSHTNLGALKKGDEVNIEVDLVARYILNR
jgi:riboflavin synthase